MRLIDAEHLKWNVSGKECGTMTVDYLLWIIDNEEETVDAIPVEWIEKYINECPTIFRDNMRWIKIMIANWREENEQKCNKHCR